jgi:hypothetical protein
MKTALIALVLATVAPAHVSIGPVSVPVTWLLAAAEVLAAAGCAWLTARAVRRFRSTPWPRPAAGGAW